MRVATPRTREMFASLTFSAAALLWVALNGCGSSLPRPPIAPNDGSGYVEVPYPPPPARIEYIPPRPVKDCVWIDGQWTWIDRWQWDAGGWVVMLPSTYFVPWAMTLRFDGKFFFAPSSWRGKDGNAVPPPTFLVHAASSMK